MRGVQLVTSDAHKGLVRAIARGVPGRFLAEMRRPPDARLHARGGVAPAPRGGSAACSRRVFRAKDAATAQAMYHVACDMLRDCCPKAAVVAEEAEPDGARLSGIPAFALEAPAHEQRAGARQPRDKAPQPASCRCSRRRSRWNAWSGPRCAEQDEIWSESRYSRARQRCRSSTTKGAPRRRPPRKVGWPSSWERRARIDHPRASSLRGKGRGGVAYPARFQVKARAKAPPCLELPFALGPPSAAPRWNGLHQHPRHYQSCAAGDYGIDFPE